MAKKTSRVAYSLADYVAEYIESADYRNDTLVPVTLAAAALGYKPTTIRAHVRQGKLKEVSVNCQNGTVKGITAGSIQAALTGRRQQVEELAEELRPWVEGMFGKTIEYGKLMDQVALSSHNPHDRDLVGRALGLLSAQSYKAVGYMISGRVVLKATGRPNESFFRFAEQLGAKKKSMSDERFWQENENMIYEAAGPQEWSDEE